MVATPQCGERPPGNGSDAGGLREIDVLPEVTHTERPWVAGGEHRLTA